VNEDDLKDYNYTFRGEYYDGEMLYDLFVDNEQIKFYGYFTPGYLRFLDNVAKKGLVRGTCIVRYEDESVPLIHCTFNKDGFNFRFVKTKYTFGQWERRKFHNRKKVK